MGFGSDFAQGFGDSNFGSGQFSTGFTKGYDEARAIMVDRQQREDAKRASKALFTQISEFEGHEALARKALILAIREGASPDEKLALQMELDAAIKGKLMGSMDAATQFAAANSGNKYTDKIAQSIVEQTHKVFAQEMQARQADHAELGRESEQRRAIGANVETREDTQAHAVGMQDDAQAHALELQRNQAGFQEKAVEKITAAKGELSAREFADQAALAWEESGPLFDESYSEDDLADLSRENPGLSQEQLRVAGRRSLTAQLLVDRNVVDSIQDFLGSSDTPEDAEGRDAAIADAPNERAIGEGIFEFFDRIGFSRLARESPIARPGGVLGEQSAQRQSDEGPQSADDAVRHVIGGWADFLRGIGDKPPSRLRGGGDAEFRGSARRKTMKILENRRARKASKRESPEST